VKKLTEKQLLFIEYYIETGNATESAKRAGYSAKTAGSIGSENLTKPEIKEAIEKRREEIRTELQNKFLASAVKAQQIMNQVLENSETPPHVKIQAAKDLMDRAGFKPTEKREITGEVHQQITFVEDLDD
jgi:phage terminase small subunit